MTAWQLIISSQLGEIHIPDTLISLMTCFMDMITPWDSLGMGSKLHVATDLGAILSVSLPLGILEEEAGHL